MKSAQPEFPSRNRDAISDLKNQPRELAQEVCPPRGQLMDFVLGKLDDRSLSGISQHIDECFICGAAAVELESDPDSLIRALRKPATRRSSPHEDDALCGLGMIVRSSVHQSSSQHTAAENAKELGRYEIRRTIGSGGMGTVYLAWDRRLERSVALKIPHAYLSHQANARERFVRESKLLAQVYHPNICPIHDVGEFYGTFYFTMPFVEGQILRQICREGRMPPRDAAALVAKCAHALQVVHEHGIVHRDLKPSNVIVRSDGEPVITDFGLARSFRAPFSDARITLDGLLVGSPAYMSPEQAKALSQLVGPSSDVYSLGVILFELLTATLPFEGVIAEVLAKVIHEPPPTPSSRTSEIDDQLDAICMQAMAKHPTARFRSMDEFAASLLDYLSNGSNEQIGDRRTVADPFRGANPDHCHMRRRQYWADRLRPVSRLFGTTRLVTLSICTAAVFCFAYALTWFSASTEHIDPSKPTGEIRLEVDDESATYIINGVPLSGARISEPLSLPVGENWVIVKRGDLIVNKQAFSVQPGFNEPLRVSSIW